MRTTFTVKVERYEGEECLVYENLTFEAAMDLSEHYGQEGWHVKVTPITEQDEL